MRRAEKSRWRGRLGGRSAIDPAGKGFGVFGRRSLLGSFLIGRLSSPQIHSSSDPLTHAALAAPGESGMKEHTWPRVSLKFLRKYLLRLVNQL
jgi:hypothetical protein